MRRWNELAIRHQCHFLSVVLQDAIGYVGPLVIPGETACYECLVAREDSNLDDSETRRNVEQAAEEGWHVVGSHPLLISVLASVAAFELVKFYGEMIAVFNVATLIEVNLLNTRITARKVLKVPRCVICSSLLQQSSVSIRRPINKQD
jgi:thiazole/oxazole-forming peptide maturase SagC family component